MKKKNNDPRNKGYDYPLPEHDKYQKLIDQATKIKSVYDALSSISTEDGILLGSAY